MNWELVTGNCELGTCMVFTRNAERELGTRNSEPGTKKEMEGGLESAQTPTFNPLSNYHIHLIGCDRSGSDRVLPGKIRFYSPDDCDQRQ